MRPGKLVISASLKYSDVWKNTTMNMATPFATSIHAFGRIERSMSVKLRPATIMALPLAPASHMWLLGPDARTREPTMFDTEHTSRWFRPYNVDASGSQPSSVRPATSAKSARIQLRAEPRDGEECQPCGISPA